MGIIVVLQWYHCVNDYMRKNFRASYSALYIERDIHMCTETYTLEYINLMCVNYIGNMVIEIYYLYKYISIF